MHYKWVCCVSALLLVAGSGVRVAAAQGQGVTSRVAPAPSPMTDTAVAGVLDQYCVTCHNERVVDGGGTAPSPMVAQLRAAGLALDTLDVSEVGTHADAWETVVRKLRGGSMPPTGRPRPDDATIDEVAGWLEGALDRAAAAAPDPGRRPALHRLSRTEYQYAVRDLLALDDLPKELDIAVMLPADNATSGFDNLADLLFVSPTLMERYLAAARKISRLAVGDPTMLPIVDTYQLDRDLVQDRHVPGLPLGTRGGTRVQSHLPLDGEYVITVQFTGAAREAHDGEISVDGERVHLFTVGLTPPKRTASGVFTFDADPDVDVRVPLRAGPRDVAVSFIPKSGALSERAVRAYRSRSRQPSIASVIISGPYGADGAGDTPSRRQIFQCRPGVAASEAETSTCARTILSALARRAYRRPVTEDDLGRLLQFYEQGRVEGGFERGIQRAIERLLVSPEFLFRIERNPDGAVAGTAYPLSDLELASRLSFFLWSSIPDDTLLELATRGELRDPAVLDREVRRLLADPRSSALVTNFAEQWLFLRDVDAKEPDAGFFPGFDENLRQAFRTETAMFVDSVLRDDRSALDLLTANHTFVNERLAKHYGIPHVYGSHFRRVELEDSRRRGLLGQGSILTLTSYGTRTSPVLRGKWILENLLSSPPPPPPPDIPALDETTEDGKPRSMREAMEVHRANPACASCHSQMDPLGFALENFDAIGRWRDRGESNLPIDASGLLPNGTRFDGPSGLRAELVKSPKQFMTTMTDKLFTYALGRGVESFDAPTIRAIVRDAERDEYRFASVVSGIVNSMPFQMRKAQ
jgi:mono/diheme cytochrome c family protein